MSYYKAIAPENVKLRNRQIDRFNHGWRLPMKSLCVSVVIITNLIGFPYLSVPRACSKSETMSAVASSPTDSLIKL